MELTNTGSLEFRSISSKQGKDRTYFYLNCETDCCEPVKIYLGTSTDKTFGLNLEKGDKIHILFDYDFQYNRLSVVSITVEA